MMMMVVLYVWQWDEEVEQKRLSDLKQQQLKQYELNRKIQKGERILWYRQQQSSTF